MLHISVQWIWITKSVRVLRSWLRASYSFSFQLSLSEVFASCRKAGRWSRKNLVENRTYFSRKVLVQSKRICDVTNLHLQSLMLLQSSLRTTKFTAKTSQYLTQLEVVWIGTQATRIAWTQHSKTQTKDCANADHSGERKYKSTVLLWMKCTVGIHRFRTCFLWQLW